MEWVRISSSGSAACTGFWAGFLLVVWLPIKDLRAAYEPPVLRICEGNCQKVAGAQMSAWSQNAEWTQHSRVLK